jgi:hypothetical protein
MSDPVAFTDLVESLTELESPAFLEEMSAELGATISGLIQDGFSKATDPYGHVWAPRKLARGRSTPPHLPLNLTGAMKGSFVVSTSHDGVRVDNPVVYTGFHQTGTRFIDARKMLPDESGLGDWEEPMRRTALGVMAKHLNAEGE